MNTLKNIADRVWCLCTAEEKHAVAAAEPAATGSLWQWYRSKNAELAERGADLVPPPAPRRLRARF